MSQETDLDTHRDLAMLRITQETKNWLTAAPITMRITSQAADMTDRQLREEFVQALADINEAPGKTEWKLPDVEDVIIDRRDRYAFTLTPWRWRNGHDPEGTEAQA